MKMKIEKRYLLLPIGKNAASKTLCIYRGEDDNRELVMDFDVKLDMLNPDLTVYLDVGELVGETVECITVPTMTFCLEQSDTQNEETDDAFRPFVHYTAKKGWTNDPNGMIKYRGKYHLFYQYNPLGLHHTYNVHWGHAVSDDMLHWEEKEPALRPDKMGLPYSGGAIEDIHNVTGLKKGDYNPILLYYTAATRSLLSGGEKWSQCMAYSIDGGEHFEKYENNPLFVNEIAPLELGYDERDPKVVWVEELGKYIMVIFVKNPNIYRFHSSDDLIHWMPMHDFAFEGDRECPDIFPYIVNGEKKWVLMGANDYYVVGDFTADGFVPQTKPKRLSYSDNKASYAAHGFSGMENGRIVKMYWDWINIPSDTIVNQMSIPVELKLCKDRDYYLMANPIEELRDLYVDEKILKDTKDSYFQIPLNHAAYDIQLKCDNHADITLRIFGQVLKYHAEKKAFMYNKKNFVPIRENADKLDIRIIVDKCSFEVFADGGRANITLPLVCDYNLPYMELTATQAIEIQELSCRALCAI